MRKNGWQFPFHPLQVVAISVFFALVITFYCFLVPFTGFTALKYVALFLYTPTGALVFLLYAWCVVINPADPGIVGISMPCKIWRQPAPETPTLYCTLCKVEILKNSRHCRSCDKCVEGFDHHCQWLNNCVGKRNYRAFFGLMVGTIFMLILVWSLGLWVLIHGFKSERFEKVVSWSFGSNFPFVAYIGVVAFCTLLAMVATYPLGHLLIFHIVLCCKGISTHDFIVAMRDLEQLRATQAGIDSHESAVSSGKGSSGSCNSQGQGWCTPPHIVFDHEESFPQPEQCVSANGGELVSRANEVKLPVKLNPWTLASLSKDDVLRSSLISVSRSSVLRPASSRNETSSSSGSHKVSDSRILCVKESVSEVVRSRLSRNCTKEHGHNDANPEGEITAATKSLEARMDSPPPTKSSKAGTDSPPAINSDPSLSSQRDVKIALDARNKELVGTVFVLSSDGTGLSSGSFRLKQGQLDMLPPHSLLSGWRWRQNPTYDGKCGSSAENSAERVSLPCTPAKSTSTLALHRLSM